MDRSDIQSVTTLSSSDFYQRIIKKYQVGKGKTFRLPTMIFYENRGHFLLKKISTNILLHLHIVNQNIMPCSTVKITSVMKGVNSWSKTENTLQSMVKSKNLQNKNYEKNTLKSLNSPRVYEFTSDFFPIEYISKNTISRVSSLKSFFFKASNITTESKKILNPVFLDVNVLKSLEVSYPYQFISKIFPTEYISTNTISIISLKSLFFKAENTATRSNKILKPLLLDVNSAFYRQLTHLVSSKTSMGNLQTLNYANYRQSIKSHLLGVRTYLESVNPAVYPTIIENTNILKFQSLFEHKSPAILSRGNSLFNTTTSSISRLFFENSNRAILNKPLIKNYYRNFGGGVPIFLQRRDVYRAGGEDLHFRDQRNIEQEIENIKRIVIETKESMLDKSKPVFGEADIKRCLDINRISSEVYKNIERTIRMERERRGV